MCWDIQNAPKIFIQPTIVVVTLTVYYLYFCRGSSNRDKENDKSNIGKTEEQLPTDFSCKNPNCVRCQRYRIVQERARSKLSWILRDMKSKDPSIFSTLNRRVPNAILHPGTRLMNVDNGNHSYCEDHGKINQLSSLQDPTVLMVFDLPSREIVTEWHKNACDYLKNRRTRTIVYEALHSLGYCNIYGGIDGDQSNDHQPSSFVASSNDSKWTINDTSRYGDWRVFHILNQGVWNSALVSEECGNGNSKAPCQNLLELVRNIPGLLDSSLFGNVFVSKILPGTKIEPHCGPTNIRHRLQFLLKLPDADFCFNLKEPTLFLSVGRKQKILWDMRNDAFVFDDSFLHSVTYRDNEAGRDTQYIENDGRGKFRSLDSSARMVLIVDLWHPGLQDVEVSLLQELYPPYTSTDVK